jgi:hypothetical protein
MSQIPILTLTAPTPRTSHHLARPSLKEILRYRYHHGPNIGSIFVLKKWLPGSMYNASAAVSSELDAVVSQDPPNFTKMKC